jgi:hypothetical protein
VPNLFAVRATSDGCAFLNAGSALASSAGTRHRGRAVGF